MKRGQVTIFIIIGLVVVAAVLLALYLNSEVVEDIGITQTAERQALPDDVAEIWDHVFKCAQITAEDAVGFAEDQGGYILPPVGSLDIDGEIIAYGLKNGVKIAPDAGVVEDEIKTYMEIFLPICAELDSFTQYEITEKEPEVVSIDLTDNELIIEINYNLDIKRGEDITKITKPFPVEIKSDMKGFLEAEDIIVDNLKADPTQISIDSFEDIEYDVDVMLYDNNIVVFSLASDTGSSYMFAAGVEK